MIKPDPPDTARWIARTLEEAGYETWTVGGAVRDALLGTPSDDWDLTTRATPGEVQRLFRRTIPIGIDHGTVGVLSGSGILYEVTTFRRDIETTGRHAVVEFAETLDEDLSRRDFTINAVAWHPLREVLHDPFDGQWDLERRVLRTVGNAGDRFSEDHLRILRALRFAGTFRLTIEADTWRALVSGVKQTDRLSPERLREELERILRGTAPPSRALSLYAASGVLDFLYPELGATVGRSRDSVGDWFSHTLRTIDCLPPHRTKLRWAAVFQGVGERAGSMGAGEAGAEAGERALRRAAAMLERLRSSNAMVREVAELARWIAWPPASDAPEEDLRRWLSEVGREALVPLLRIWIASVRADEALLSADSGRPTVDRASTRILTRGEVLELRRRLQDISRSDVPLTVAELAVSGRDIIQMGQTPGPHFGEILDHLLDRVLEDPGMNRSEALRDEIRRWMAERGGGPE